MTYIAVHISCDKKDQETVAFMLQNAGFTGSSFQDDGLVAYCLKEDFAKDQLMSILKNFGIAPDEITEVYEENWNAVWERNFREVIVNETIQVRAPFHPSKNLKHEIVILPQMAFGTGHHETTKLSLQALDELTLNDMDVLDMGCGSGILAIFCSLKGAKEVLAIDYDAQSVQNCEENVQLNHIQNVLVKQANNLVNVTQKFDVIVSNIIKSINIGLLPEFTSKLNTGGLLILSGLLKSDYEEVRKVAEALKLNYKSKTEGNDWIQLTFQG